MVAPSHGAGELSNSPMCPPPIHPGREEDLHHVQRSHLAEGKVEPQRGLGRASGRHTWLGQPSGNWQQGRPCLRHPRAVSSKPGHWPPRGAGAGSSPAGSTLRCRPRAVSPCCRAHLHPRRQHIGGWEWAQRESGIHGAPAVCQVLCAGSATATGPLHTMTSGAAVGQEPSKDGSGVPVPVVPRSFSAGSWHP